VPADGCCQLRECRSHGAAFRQALLASTGYGYSNSKHNSDSAQFKGIALNLNCVLIRLPLFAGRRSVRGRFLKIARPETFQRCIKSDVPSKLSSSPNCGPKRSQSFGVVLRHAYQFGGADHAWDTCALRVTLHPSTARARTHRLLAERAVGTTSPSGVIPFRNLKRSLPVERTSVVFSAMMDL
jgi:hypothetical protein